MVAGAGRAAPQAAAVRYAFLVRTAYHVVSRVRGEEVTAWCSENK